MKLSKQDILYYGTGNLGYSVVCQTITNFFMFFGISVLKIPGTLVGLAVAISTLWDGISDPVVGYLSDNKPMGKMGHRHGYMIIAVIGMSVAGLFIWCVPMNMSIGLKCVWILIALLVSEFFNTLFATPYSALGNDMSKEYDQRTIVQSVKTVFSLLGMVIPSVLMAVFLGSTEDFPQGQLNPAGYRNIAWVNSLLMLAAGTICVIGTFKFAKQEPKQNTGKTIKPAEEKISFKILISRFLECLREKDIRCLILGSSAAFVSGSILTSVGMHFFTYCMYYSSLQITLTLLSLILGMILFQPLWYKLSKKQDKKPALLQGLIVTMFSVIIIMLAYIFKYQLVSAGFYIILIVIFFVGAGAGSLYSLPISMFSDAMELRGDKNKTATYLGFLTLANNVAGAFALFLSGLLLDVFGFNPDAFIQVRSVQTGIAVALFAGVELALLAAFLAFRKYRIKRNHLEK